MQSAAGRGSVARAMKRFYGAAAQHAEVFDLALARLEVWVPEQADTTRVGAAKPKRTKPRRTRAKLKKTKADDNLARWHACRSRRKCAGAPPAAATLEAYRSAVLADQRFVKKSFFPDAPRRPRASGQELVAVVAATATFRQQPSPSVLLGCSTGAGKELGACALLAPRCGLCGRPTSTGPRRRRKFSGPSVAAARPNLRAWFHAQTTCPSRCATSRLPPSAPCGLSPCMWGRRRLPRRAIGKRFA